MIDTVETLIQSAQADDPEFRELARRLGQPERLVHLLFDEGVRVQATNPGRAMLCAAVIDRLQGLLQSQPI
ncbi:hypothetical protein JL101_035535 (plasmid) [Skermanella rosea]|uniref:hypothetical protein n=1 Tax=Skermanella rosea TaxID=1817965 RepID=UPI00193290DB|nr:hypothetical protein [Skermanella rosea]UEM08112.1 hypothetical protein JL101_035535 [Skermanella rosea]